MYCVLMTKVESTARVLLSTLFLKMILHGCGILITAVPTLHKLYVCAVLRQEFSGNKVRSRYPLIKSGRGKIRKRSKPRAVQDFHSVYRTAGWAAP